MTGEGAMHGWGCTPPGEAPRPSAEHPGPNCLPAVVFRGWRKTALYCILILLMVLIFLNIGLTLWIISSLKLRMVSCCKSEHSYFCFIISIHHHHHHHHISRKRASIHRHSPYTLSSFSWKQLLPIRDLHSETIRTQRLSVLRAMWPARVRVL